MIELKLLQEHDVEYKKTNREKCQTPKVGKRWCGCDRSYISSTGVCPVCKSKPIGFRLKEDTI